MGEGPSPMPSPPRAEGGFGASLRAAEFQVEAADLELLVRIRRELDVLLEPVVLVGLDDRKPREILQEDLGHVAIGLGAELLVHREPRRVAQLQRWNARRPAQRGEIDPGRPGQAADENGAEFVDQRGGLPITASMPFSGSWVSRKFSMRMS